MLLETDPETGKIKPLPLPEWVRSSATKLSDKKSCNKIDVEKCSIFLTNCLF